MENCGEIVFYAHFLFKDKDKTAHIRGNAEGEEQTEDFYHFSDRVSSVVICNFAGYWRGTTVALRFIIIVPSDGGAVVWCCPIAWAIIVRGSGGKNRSPYVSLNG